MTDIVVYFPAKTEEGYHSEVISHSELQSFLENGWFESPIQCLEIVKNNDNENPKKRGRPKSPPKD